MMCILTLGEVHGGLSSDKLLYTCLAGQVGILKTRRDNEVAVGGGGDQKTIKLQHMHTDKWMTSPQFYSLSIFCAYGEDAEVDDPL